MKNVRILYFLSESYPTFRVDVNNLFGKFLCRDGIFSDLVTTADNGHVEKKWSGGNLFLRGSTRFNNVNKFFYCFLFLFFLKKHDYDAVQVRDMPIIGFFLLIICHVKKIKFFYWSSYPIPLGQIIRAKSLKILNFKKIPLLIRGYVGNIMMRIIIRNSNHIFAQSERMKSDFIRVGGDSENITAVPMGVDFESIIESKDAIAKVRNRTIAYLGTMDPQRKIEFLIKAVFLAKKLLPDIKLLIIGDTVYPEHKENIMNLINILDLSSSVEITGWMNIEDAWKRLSQCTIGVSFFPRGDLLDSASPTKVPEYLALGLPVICNDNPDQLNVIQSSGAGVCVPFDENEIANAISKLLLVSDKDFSRMIQSGQQYVRKFRDYSVISSQLAKKYRELCCD